LDSIFRALDEIGKHIPVILPLHPRTKKMAKVYRLFSTFKNIRFIEPVPYLDMLNLERNAKAILTDSGGVQKEAYWLRVPCVTLREETEWVETIKSGWNVLAGTNAKRIVGEIGHLEKGRKDSGGRKIYGDGNSSQKIIKSLVRHFS
jgi:UDP-N-acetylglucosamine 2-epimerase